MGHEDWELWARAVLQGYKLQVVPEAPCWYRVLTLPLTLPLPLTLTLTLTLT